MSAHDDGGPAFPRLSDTRSGEFPGMTLRDWFAGQALVGMMAYRSAGGPVIAALHASAAYEIADAMLAERAKP